MYAGWSDHHRDCDSWLCRLPAGVKLPVAVGLVLAMVVVPARWAVGLWGFAGLLALLLAISGVSVRLVVRKLLLLEPMVLVIAVAAAFQPAGWRGALLLASRSTLCLATMVLLASTTPFMDILRVLRRWRVPPLLVTTLMLMHRYLFVLADQAHRMRRARQGRTFTPRRALVWRHRAGIIAHLFVRTSNRAQRIYWAMSARGWQ